MCGSFQTNQEILKPTDGSWKKPQRSWNQPLCFLVAWKRSSAHHHQTHAFFFQSETCFFRSFRITKTRVPFRLVLGLLGLYTKEEVWKIMWVNPGKGTIHPKKERILLTKQHGFQGLPLYVRWEGSRWLYNIYMLLFYEFKDSCYFSNKDLLGQTKNLFRQKWAKFFESKLHPWKLEPRKNRKKMEDFFHWTWKNIILFVHVDVWGRNMYMYDIMYIYICIEYLLMFSKNSCLSSPILVSCPHLFEKGICTLERQCVKKCTTTTTTNPLCLCLLLAT